MTRLQSLVRTYATAKTILVLFFLTQALYLVMLGVTIPHVTQYADDMALFDLRPQGYSAAAAQDLLDTLGGEGRRAYLTRQIPLDLVYPGLFIVTYTLMLGYIFQRTLAASSRLHWLIVVPVLAGVFDYLENGGIVLMLVMYPDFSSTVAQASSVFSIAKSALTTLFFVVLLAALVKWLFDFLRTRRAPRASAAEREPLS